MFCLIYEEYLNRRKCDISKSKAKLFDEPASLQTQFLQGILEDDIFEALQELRNNHFVRLYIDGSFQLEDNGIIYMENRFKNGLKEVFGYLSLLK